MTNIKKLLSGRSWLVIKVIMFNWTIFILLVAGYTLWVQYETIKYQNIQIQNCQEFDKQIRDQMKSGKVILELKK